MSPEQIAEKYLTIEVVEAYKQATLILGTPDVVVFRPEDGNLQTFRRTSFLRHHPLKSLEEEAEGDASYCFWYVVQLPDHVACINIAASLTHNLN